MNVFVYCKQHNIKHVTYFYSPGEKQRVMIAVSTLYLRSTEAISVQSEALFLDGLFSSGSDARDSLFPNYIMT